MIVKGRRVAVATESGSFSRDVSYGGQLFTDVQSELLALDLQQGES